MKFLLSHVACSLWFTNFHLSGILSLNSIIPRLPFASNHLGISEETTVALLCCLLELFDENSDNARSAQWQFLLCDTVMWLHVLLRRKFREKEGIPFITRLTRSRQHTQKVIFAANKVSNRVDVEATTKWWNLLSIHVQLHLYHHNIPVTTTSMWSLPFSAWYNKLVHDKLLQLWWNGFLMYS